MSVYLLDVNVLIALIDPLHLRHEEAHEWFGSAAAAGWATCPMTENGALPIVGHSRYPNSPGTPAAVAEVLQSLRSLPGHQFWPDDISLLGGGAVQPSRLSRATQVTDTYLLALACAHGGRLATFDRRLVPDAVPGGLEALFLIGRGSTPIDGV